MDKTLYISDLDGTLLNSCQEVSQQSLFLLNALIKKGTYFSVATARTPATVEDLLQDMAINIPVVLMNGAVIYDLKKHSYIKVEYIEEQLVRHILQNLGRLSYEGFIYTIAEDKLCVYYETLRNEYQKIFYEERKDKHMDTFEKIDDIYKKLESIKGLALSMYRDIYNEGAYFLEVYSDRATKANGVAYIKKKYSYNKVISFGDNLNDLTMFKFSDECYAVHNAHPDVKEIATAVIGSHNEDAVAKFIDKHQALARSERSI